MKKDFFEPGVVYHLFNRGNNKEDIFKEEENYVYFLSLVEKYLLPIAEIYAYCLLKNHFHFVLRIKDIEFIEKKYKKKPHLPFSNYYITKYNRLYISIFYLQVIPLDVRLKIAGDLFNSYAKAINKRYNRSGSLFQEHLKRKRIEKEEYLMQLIAYVHLNPVKHGFSNDFIHYHYSSYRAYISEEPTNVSCDYVMSLFGDRDNFIYWHNSNRLDLEDQIDNV